MREQKEKAKHVRTSRKSQRLKLVEGANVICTTLSSAGSHLLSQIRHGFGTVVVDESAQVIIIIETCRTLHEHIACLTSFNNYYL